MVTPWTVDLHPVIGLAANATLRFRTLKPIKRKALLRPDTVGDLVEPLVHRAGWEISTRT